ncbi:hypothetical protein AVL48_18750 [Amycolatopsis regifaucium]|uniref:Uncharacterized protein n=1 Tax=Amycolatopsis regifaucium TaxID=546365 RepID=A0A154MUJ3_9PSEU|nr:hypothetical protein AVL48_18750 [Amycolatopsis regifaucium]OKA04479.1 hypothetical protein ATP06_0231760 [Amycolatopsis regifaucium]
MIDAGLNRLMRLRPFGAGRKYHRSSAEYAPSHQGRSEVTVTTIEERRKNPPVPLRRKRQIVHPDTLTAIRELTASLRLQRTGSSALAPSDAHSRPENRHQVSPAAGSPVTGAVKPTPALLANLRRPAPAPPAPVQHAPARRVPRGRTSPLLAQAGSSSSAALGPAVEAMLKARARTQPKRPFEG